MKKISQKVLLCAAVAILLCFAACKNSSSPGDYIYFAINRPNSDSGIEIPEGSYSFGGDLPGELKIAETDSSGKKNFSAEENADGIYIKFAIPNEDVVCYEIFIEGIGQVSENWFGSNLSETDFFYPFLAPGKEYTVRIKFLKDEESDDDGFTIESSNRTVGYIDMKAKAGASSKGEVKLSNFGIIDVKKNGDFKFTKKPAFKNENLLTGNDYDWVLGIGLNEGVSWDHPNRRSKWLTEIEISNKDLLDKTYNFYTYPRPYGEVKKVDFILWRPKMYYQYGGKEYKYQWDGKTLDTNCTAESELWTNININNSTDVAKIKGTWRYDEVFYDDPMAGLTTNFTELYDIDDESIAVKYINAITKRNGSAFTKKEIAERWCASSLSDTLPSNCFYYEEVEFYDNSNPGGTTNNPSAVEDKPNDSFESGNSSNENFGGTGDTTSSSSGNSTTDNSSNSPSSGTSAGEDKDDSTGGEYVKPGVSDNENEQPDDSSNGNVSEEIGTGVKNSLSARNISSYRKTAYKYKIYTLDSNVTIFSDSKTVTTENGYTETLVEYFADYESSSSSYTRHYDLKLFEGGIVFRVSWSGKDEVGKDYKWHRDFQKQ